MSPPCYFLPDQVGQASFNYLVDDGVHAFVFAALVDQAGLEATKIRVLVTDMWIYVQAMTAFIAAIALKNPAKRQLW